MRLLKVMLVAGLLGLPGAGSAEDALITVTGEGHAMAVPDMAMLTLGVSTDAPTASAALSQNSAHQAEVIARLKAAGIADLDIQTADLSLGPRYENGGGSDSAPKMVGFVASNTVRIRVRMLDTLGKVLDAAVKDGANTLSGLSFDLSDPAAEQEAARRAAVADAMARARVYADAAGVKLGPIRSISESGGEVRPMPMMKMSMAAAAVPVQQGEMSIDASVTMVFAIAP